MARNSSSYMPFAVSQGNIFTASLGGILGIGGILDVLSSVPNPAAAQATIWLAFGGGAILMLRPVNPFSKPGGRAARPDELSTVERRILWAFYSPQNRRYAGGSVLLAGAFTEAAYIAIRVALAPAASESDRGFAPLFIGCILSSVAIVWIGLFGLTIRMRREWNQIVSSGPEWPVDLEYPGPFRDAVVSALRNRLPAWLETRLPAAGDVSVRGPT